MMDIDTLNFRRSIHDPGSCFATLPRWHVTVWRYNDGTYGLQKGFRWRRRGLEPIAAKAILHELTKTTEWNFSAE
jgi:hypothetical protein